MGNSGTGPNPEISVMENWEWDQGEKIREFPIGKTGITNPGWVHPKSPEKTPAPHSHPSREFPRPHSWLFFGTDPESLGNSRWRFPGNSWNSHLDGEHDDPEAATSEHLRLPQRVVVQVPAKHGKMREFREKWEFWGNGNSGGNGEKRGNGNWRENGNSGGNGEKRRNENWRENGNSRGNLE